MNTFLVEANRILKLRGHLLILPPRAPSTTRVGARLVKFNVLRKDPFDPDWTRKIRGCETYWTHFVRFESCWWAARPWVYRSLMQRYSSVGDIVVHVFSGSGNSGVAALAVGRKPVLIDLRYHRNALKRLRQYVRQWESKGHSV